MPYADYAYYRSAYLLGRSPLIPEEDFLFWEKRARMELDAWTFGRIKEDVSLVSEDVQDVICALSELFYQADQLEAHSGGMGPLVSFSNDGQSGTFDLSQSQYTENGKKRQARALIYQYLGNTGLLCAAVERRCCR